MSNSFKLCPTHFYREDKKFSKGGEAPPWLRACMKLYFNFVRYQQCHCLAALPAMVSVLNSHMHGSHSVISNKPRLHTKKTIFVYNNAILDKQKGNLDHSDEKYTELQMYLFNVENRAALCFSKY